MRHEWTRRRLLKAREHHRGQWSGSYKIFPMMLLLVLSACGNSGTGNSACPRELVPPDDALAAMGQWPTGTDRERWLAQMTVQQERLQCLRLTGKECQP